MTSKEVAERLLQKWDLKLDKKSLVCNGQKYHRTQFYRAFPNASLKNTSLDFITGLEPEEKKEFLRKVFDHLFRELESDIKEEVNQYNSLMIEELDPENMKNYVCVQDVVTGDYHMLCRVTHRLINLSVDFWRANLPPDAKKYSKPIPAVLKYDPFSLKTAEKSFYRPHIDSPELPVLKVNLHLAPNWRYMDVGEPEYPEPIKEFMEFFIPDVKCRKYVLNWLRYALISQKNETYLVLNGRKGTGKGLFAQIVKELVGHSNYSKANRSFLTKEFNGILENNRMILVDEQSINTPDKLDVLKDYANVDQNIEKKNMDATKIVETFCSFIIENNREVDLKVEQDDRRFSVIDITDVIYKDRFGEHHAEKFLTQIKDPDIIANFGHYILEKCDYGYPIGVPWKGPKFQRLVQVSLWEWQKFILSTIESREETFYELDRLKIRYNQLRTSTKSSLTIDLVRDFLKNYVHEGRSLGEVIKMEGQWGVKPSPHFLPSSGRELL